MRLRPLPHSRALVTFASVVAFGLVVALGGGVSPAAENFDCGAGGKPDPKTSKCLCGAGKIEKTTGGTSRCVDKPVAQPKPTTTTKPTAQPKPTTTSSGTVTPPLPTNLPPIPTATTTTTGTVSLPPIPECAPGQAWGPLGCHSVCRDDQLWKDGVCTARCAPPLVWNGATCASPAATATSCEGGQVDLGGHCCWPGQTWVPQGAGGQCRGTPMCPTGFDADERENCVPGTCLPGQVRPDGVHCCWSGQSWSKAQNLCVGTPSCPEGYQVDGDRCTPLRLCDPGQVAVDPVHCCWPGQHWMMRASGDVGCGGTPSCPAPLVSSGEDCLPADKIKEDADRASKTALLGSGYITFDFGYLIGPGTGSSRWTGYGFGGAIHPSGFPLRLAAMFDLNTVKYTPACDPTASSCDGELSATATGYTLSASFAPLSLPSAAVNQASLLNPWIGLQYRGWNNLSTTGSSSAGNVPNTGGKALAMEIGNLMMAARVGLTTMVAVTIGGPDLRPQTTFTIGVAYLLTPAF